MLDADLARYCDEHRDEHVAELKRWIAIPSISADPERRGDVKRCAETIASRLTAIGMRAELLETAGNPLVYGEWSNAPGKPTAIVYGHYDVQPADPIDLWQSPPFSAEVRDGELFGRGTVDDKGQVLAHVAAMEAHFSVRGKLPLNLKVIVEGEEEIGSPNFEDALAKYAQRFAADLAIISDTAMYSEDVPSLATSIRGLIHWEITVHGPQSDLHSGLHGGAVRNPIEALASILAQLKDAEGRVRVPDFYAGVGEVDSKTRSELNTLARGDAREAQRLERIWYRPTLECNGIWGGYQGPGTKTIIPSWARAKLSARLVGTQDPASIKTAVAAFIEQLAPEGVRVEVESSGDTRAVTTSRDHPAVIAAARAVESVFGKAPVFIGTGGTIGPVASFDRILQLPQVLLGFGLPDDSTHAPNEKFTLSQLFRGIKALAHLYDELPRAYGS